MASSTLADEFQHSEEAEPHGDRTRAIIAQHPEIRQLFGRNPYTLVPILALVGLQFVLAYALRAQPVWQVLVVAFLIGAVAQHGLYVLMHETNHNLLFRKRWMNSVSGIISNLAGVVPASASFQRYHLKHHAYQGIHELDGDLPSYWEARLVGHSTVGKALWLFCFPVFLALRPAHLRGMTHLCRWTVTNIIVVLSVNVAVYVYWGPAAFLYLFASMWFSLGIHPVGARWIQEHFVFNPPQETYSYYGGANLVAFNIGYHNEHHDFPSIPWNRIPRVKALAPEWYDNLAYHKSWTKLALRFIFDPRISLYSRVDRPGETAPGGAPVPQLG